MRVWRALTLPWDDKDNPRPTILSLRLPSLPLPRAHALQASLRASCLPCVHVCMLWVAVRSFGCRCDVNVSGRCGFRRDVVEGPCPALKLLPCPSARGTLRLWWHCPPLT
jgi:hypothetical protein